MTGPYIFYLILGLVVILNIVAIIVWLNIFSSRKACESNESPIYCYTFVCPSGDPATRINSAGNTVKSGKGVLDPNLF